MGGPVLAMWRGVRSILQDVTVSRPQAILTLGKGKEMGTYPRKRLQAPKKPSQK